MTRRTILSAIASAAAAAVLGIRPKLAGAAVPRMPKIGDPYPGCEWDCSGPLTYTITFSGIDGMTDCRSYQGVINGGPWKCCGDAAPLILLSSVKPGMRIGGEVVQTRLGRPVVTPTMAPFILPPFPPEPNL